MVARETCSQGKNSPASPSDEHRRDSSDSDDSRRGKRKHSFSRHKEGRILSEARRRKFLELRSLAMGQASEEETLTSYLKYCAAEHRPGIVVEHNSEYSLVTVYLEYSQLNRARTLLYSLVSEGVLRDPRCERSEAERYLISFRHEDREAARQQAIQLVENLIPLAKAA